MQLHNQNILFFTRTMALGGTENVVIQLCEILKPLVKNIVVCSTDGINVKILRKMGIRHYVIPDITKKSVDNLLIIRNKVKRIVEEEQITVIHTHHRMAAFYTQLLGSDKTVWINTSHTSFYDKKILTHIAFRNFHLVACGEGVKKSLVEGLGFSPGRITVICNGVKRKTDETREIISEVTTARKRGHYLCATIGRLSTEKGVEHLVKAIPLLTTKNITCLIVGDGPNEQMLRKMVKEMQLEDKIVFLGYRKDVTNIISQVDFIVQPSLQEGLPLVPIEAFSLGKPVVATDIEGNAEIIDDKKNGLLVKVADENELAKAIDYMCNLDREKMEKNARATFEKKYSFNLFSEAYINYYKSL